MSHSPRKMAAIALLAFGLAGAFSAPALGQDGFQKGAGVDAPVERAVLENGLTVLLRPIQGAEQTALVVLYSMGSDHDPAGRSGLGHLSEHIYLMAAAGREKSRTTEDFHKRYPDGANGQTGDRYTVFAATFPEKDLDDELRDASARMGEIRVTAADLDQERPRVLEEIGNMFGNFPALAAQNNARELIRPSPAGGRHGGEAGQLRALRTRNIQEHLGRYYRPRNATLVLAGGFDPAVARRSILAHFEKLAPGEKPPPPGSPGPPRFGALKEIAANSPDPEAPSMACLAYVAPSPGSELYAPFLVLVARLWADAEKLGDGGMGFPVYFTPLDDGAVVAVSTPAKEGESPQKAIGRLETFVAKIVGPRLRDNEPEDTLNRLGFLFQTVPIPDKQLAENPYAVAFAVGRREQLGLDPVKFNRSIESVSEANLRRAAAEFFDPARHAAAFVKK